MKKLLTDLVDKDRIQTTVARAKAIYPLANKKKEILLKIYRELLPRYRDLNDGPFTRIWRVGNRPRDQAPMAIIEFVGAPFDLKDTLYKFAIEKGIQPAEINLGHHPADILSFRTLKKTPNTRQP